MTDQDFINFSPEESANISRIQSLTQELSITKQQLHEAQQKADQWRQRLMEQIQLGIDVRSKD